MAKKKQEVAWFVIRPHMIKNYTYQNLKTWFVEFKTREEARAHKKSLVGMPDLDEYEIYKCVKEVQDDKK